MNLVNLEVLVLGWCYVLVFIVSAMEVLCMVTLCGWFPRVLIISVKGKTKCQIREQQCGCKRGERCMFSVRHVCEKYLVTGTDVFIVFVGLNKV